MKVRELRIKEVKRSCGVRGCSNTARGARVFSIMRTSEAGAGMAIMCEDCIKEAYEKVFAAKEASAKEAEKSATKKSATKKASAKKE